MFTSIFKSVSLNEVKYLLEKQMKQYQGGCHCGAVRFEVNADDNVTVERCNCSICTKSGYLHLIVPARDFKLLSGKDKLTLYQFNSGVAKHYFCSICGVKSFYIPRSNPDGVDVNFNCIEPPKPNVQIEEFDGKNWEQHAHKLAHKSR